MLHRTAPGARTRGLRRKIRQSRRPGRRFRPQRRSLPRTGGTRLRVHRNRYRHPAPAGGQPAPARVPAAQRPGYHQPHRALQPRAGQDDLPPAPPARRAHRGLQHRQEHRDAPRKCGGRLPPALPQPLPVCGLFHGEYQLRQLLPRRHHLHTHAHTPDT